VRNNLSQPSIGHVIMFGAVTLGWLLLFLITLGSGGSTFWIKLVFSGLFMIGSAAVTVLFLVRVIQQKKSAKQG
jgi:hypothetical protein